VIRRAYYQLRESLVIDSLRDVRQFLALNAPRNPGSRTRLGDEHVEA
jgi:hypothetical protein